MKKIKHHAVDFHGTLAEHEPAQNWEDIDNMPPVPKMVDRVKTWLAKEHKVTIFSASVDPVYDWDGRNRRAISAWSDKNIGITLPVTAMKSRDYTDIWDNIAHGVVDNKGKKRK